MIKSYLNYIWMRWWFRRTLAKFFVFNFSFNEIVCVALREEEQEYLWDEMRKKFPTHVSDVFSAGNEFETNVKNMLRAKLKKGVV